MYLTTENRTAKFCRVSNQARAQRRRLLKIINRARNAPGLNGDRNGTEHEIDLQ